MHIDIIHADMIYYTYMTSTSNEYTRISATIRKSTLENYRKAVPNPNVSKVVEEALTEQVAREKRRKAMEELRKLGPAFPDIEDASAWVRELRAIDLERDKRLGLL